MLLVIGLANLIADGTGFLLLLIIVPKILILQFTPDLTFLISCFSAAFSMSVSDYLSSKAEEEYEKTK